ncbi:MAG: Ldh family oxidoreductase [Pseudolabrys sp.]|nr:Ldh family oxidoreductase [Pseudolabrys sp.]
MSIDATENTVSAAEAEAFVTALLSKAGLQDAAAAGVSRAIVDAELAGLSSHGLSQLPMYVRRLQLGSVSTASRAVIVEDRDAIAVLDAQGMFGQLAGDQAMQIAIEKSRRFGVGVVAVRNSFHFGAAGRFAQQASDSDCIGMAMCNTKPMMPAPGGAERLVGNNPLAVGIPAKDGADFLLDMALSEAALAKVRIADRENRPIPATWAVDKDGTPTTDAKAAIAGMMLPAGGAKGFGLALAINLLASGLAQGPGGDDVPSMYDDLAKPFVCSLLFIAFDIAHFRGVDSLRVDVGAALNRMRQSRSPGESIRTPGQRNAESRHQKAQGFAVPRSLADTLNALSRDLGLSLRMADVKAPN